MLTPGVRPTFKVSRERRRRPPLDYAEAVEKWAREHGGHAKLVWYEKPINCWAVVLSFRVGDPRAKTNADGEPVFLHDWKQPEWWAKYAPGRAKRHPRTNRIMPAAYAYELDELGVEGIIERLDRGNILSGRGQFTSVEQAGEKTKQDHKDSRERLRQQRKDEAGHRARDRRRSLYKIPFLPVGIELTKESKTA